MICRIALCILLHGGGPRECDLSVNPEFFDLRDVTSQQACAERFRTALGGILVIEGTDIPIPANIRPMQFAWFKPQKPTQTANQGEK